MRKAEREKVYFIVNEKHLRKNWPELLERPLPFNPDQQPGRILSGLDCWTLQTWARLCAMDCPFEPVLATRAVENEVCCFHWDDAVPRLGVHRCYAVVVQADRPVPALADLTVTQNGLEGETETRRGIPLWRQPGLIPRDPARGTRLETMTYMGSDQYMPPFVGTAAFREALRARGVRFVRRAQGDWHDYRDIDAILAVRNCPSVVLATKPASKLINAWAAGVPALLGPEPAYREWRASPLDFWEIRNAEDVLEAIDRLRSEPRRYADMVANGRQRAEAFSVQRIGHQWIRLLADALARKPARARSAFPRYWRYACRRQRIRMNAWLAGWRD